MDVMIRSMTMLSVCQAVILLHDQCQTAVCKSERRQEELGGETTDLKTVRRWSKAPGAR